MKFFNIKLFSFEQAQNFDHANVQEQMRIQHVSKWIVFSYSDFTQEELNLIHLDNVLFLKQISMKTVNNCKVMLFRYIHY